MGHAEACRRPIPHHKGPLELRWCNCRPLAGGAESESAVEREAACHAPANRPQKGLVFVEPGPPPFEKPHKAEPGFAARALLNRRASGAIALSRLSLAYVSPRKSRSRLHQGASGLPGPSLGRKLLIAA